jgi:hypothetical protein
MMKPPMANSRSEVLPARIRAAGGFTGDTGGVGNGARATPRLHNTVCREYINSRNRCQRSLLNLGNTLSGHRGPTETVANRPQWSNSVWNLFTELS